MGQKVHPVGFRLGYSRTWESTWFANAKDYAANVDEDRQIRALVMRQLANAAVSRVLITRAAQQLSVTLHTARPGVVIGRSGEAVERLRKSLEELTKRRVRVNVLEIRKPALDSVLVARRIAEQLERRVNFRRAMKQAIDDTMKSDAKGIRIVVGGRLGGAEMKSKSKESRGSVPLHTLRAYIDYGTAEAKTTYGMIGVKVWIYRGDVIPGKTEPAPIVEPAGAMRVRTTEERRSERTRTPRARTVSAAPEITLESAEIADKE